jgi:hypothetical protein
MSGSSQDSGPALPPRLKLWELGVDMGRAGAAICDRTRDRASFDGDRQAAVLHRARLMRDQINAVLREEGEMG